MPSLPKPYRKFAYDRVVNRFEGLTVFLVSVTVVGYSNFGRFMPLRAAKGRH